MTASVPEVEVVIAARGLRRAGTGDADVLLGLERACGLEALGHVFPPDEFPYPDEQVRARWQRRLRDPAATTLLAIDDRSRTPVGFVCVRDGVVEHLGVHPSRQRQGVGRQLLAEAVRVALAGGAAEVSLWCLAENHRALRFYGSLGWVETGQSRAAEFAPYPVERRLRAVVGDRC